MQTPRQGDRRQHFGVDNGNPASLSNLRGGRNTRRDAKTRNLLAPFFELHPRSPIIIGGGDAGASPYGTVRIVRSQPRT